MKPDFKAFWEDVMALPYAPNSQSDPKHEKQIKKLLEKHGFTVITKEKFKKNYKSDYTLLPNGFVVYQPNGSQRPPDFIVKYNDKLYPIECKTGSKQKTSPMYNSSIPTEGSAYIFCASKYDETTVFFGEDVMEEEQRNHIMEYWRKIELLAEECNNHPIMKNSKRGWAIYARRMLIQQGSQDITDYFTHTDRSLCESNVLNYNW